MSKSYVYILWVWAKAHNCIGQTTIKRESYHQPREFLPASSTSALTPLPPQATTVPNSIHHRWVLRSACERNHTQCPLPLSPTFLRSICAVSLNILLLSISEWCSIPWVYELTTLSPIDAHLGSLRYLAIGVNLPQRLGCMSLLVEHLLSFLWGLAGPSHMTMALSILIHWQAQRNLRVPPGRMMWSLGIQSKHNCLCLNSDSVLL